MRYRTNGSWGNMLWPTRNLQFKKRTVDIKAQIHAICTGASSMQDTKAALAFKFIQVRAGMASMCTIFDMAYMEIRECETTAPISPKSTSAHRPCPSSPTAKPKEAEVEARTGGEQT